MSGSAHEVLVLHSGTAELGVAPSLGACIAFYRSAWQGAPRNWLNPAPEPLAAGTRPGQTGCFPLVPFSGRIRQGKLRWGGRTHTLPVNPRYAPHAIHGHGWEAAWRVDAQQADTLGLSYHHMPDAWNWEYKATLTYRLTPDALTVEMGVHNEDDAPMPAGLGLHPYFPKTPGATITTQVAEQWVLDAGLMPKGRAQVPAEWPFASGLQASAVALDNAFYGWGGEALIQWPEDGAALRLSAAPPLGQLVVYTPPERPYFCVEPVSHRVDGFNGMDAGDPDTGTVVLDPGSTLRATVEFRPLRPQPQG